MSEVPTPATPISRAPVESWQRRWPVYAGLAVWVGLMLALRLTGPPDLLDQDQERPATYVLDALQNGRWFCQRDYLGGIMSKPPLWTWLSALVAFANGRISPFTLYLPGALALLGTAWLVYGTGRQRFGGRAAVFAALATLVSAAGFKEVALARTDGVFAFTVALAAFLAFRAWMVGRGWTWFWLAAASATLAKGPLGLLLASSGLMASRWERQSGHPAPLRGTHVPGLLLYLGLVGGWFCLAYAEGGQPFVDRVLGDELLGHAIGAHDRGYLHAFLWQQPLYFLGRVAPWSLLAYAAVWRVWRRPALEGEERRFERFLFCWFVPGLVLFSVSAHQRADLLWPLIPAGALLAGRELERVTARFQPAAVHFAVAAAIALLGFGFAYYYHWSPRSQANARRETVALRTLAQTLEQAYRGQFPLSHLDAPMTLQVYLNTFRARIGPRQAARLLREPAAAFVAVQDLGPLDAARSPEDPPYYTLLPPPSSDVSRSPARIVSNRPTLALAPGDAYAFASGCLVVRARRAVLLKTAEDAFWFQPQSEPGEVAILNDGSRPFSARVCVAGARGSRWREHTLAAGETWSVPISLEPDSP